MSTPVVHQIAKNGFAVGTSEHYDRARPSYQSVVLSHVRRAVSKTEGLNIIEVGSGTGIFTRALLVHPEWQSCIAEVRAVEPSEGMRNVFTKTVTDPRASVTEGTFDRTGAPDSWADLIVIAQAFHWCLDHDAALKEFARILKPDGTVAFVWNIADSKRAAWVSQLFDLSAEYDKTGSPSARDDQWRGVFSAPAYAAFFRPQEETVFSWEIPATTALVQDRVLSTSYIASEPEASRDEVRKKVSDIIEKGDGKVWIDEEKGEFEHPYETVVIVFHRV